MNRVLIILLLLLFAMVYVSAEPCGDVNSDGSIDIVDSLLVAQFYVNDNQQEIDEAASDVNADGGIDIVDALLLAQYYTGLIDVLECSSTPSPTSIVTPMPPELVFAVNCGGNSYEASDGTRFSSDKGFAGGTAYDNGKQVSGTSDQTLFSTERYGNFSYQIEALNGDYEVTLYFAENYITRAGSRIFNVSIQDKEVLSRLDVFDEVGASAAFISEQSVKVTNGEIKIEFESVVENALANAIKIEAIRYSGEPVVKFSVDPSKSKPGDVVTVDASESKDPDGEIVEYEIDWGDGTVDDDVVSTHIYDPNVEDTYTIKVTVTDNDGKTASASQDIKVAESSMGDECPFTETANPSGSNWVNGDLITFNNSGGWCWYQDERAIVDVENNKLIVGSVQGGQAHVVHWDLGSNRGQKFTLDPRLPYNDDHDTAAFIKTKDGGYAAVWAAHNTEPYSYYSYFNGTSWASKKTFNWSPNASKVTYANTWYMGDTIYCYVRSVSTSPNYLYSTDHGRSWKFGGRLTSTPQVGYVAGYYKYWGNNEDRIDFLGTEAHPRDEDNSLYHGYVQDGKIHNSFGKVIDSDFSDQNASRVTAYTQMFKTGTTIHGVRLNHAWNADLVRYEDGTVAAIWTARVANTGTVDPDKRLLYARFDGESWKLTYLAKAGTKLYSSEQDYTGLGALDPDNPQVIYISTPYDPRTDSGSNNGKKEIWKGVSCDDGKTFKWVQITSNSSMDNIRPIVPKWDGSHRALLWMRGSYSSAQNYNMAIVGLIER